MRKMSRKIVSHQIPILFAIKIIIHYYDISLIAELEQGENQV